MKLDCLRIAQCPFRQSPTKIRFYERECPIVVPSPFELGFLWLFRLIRVRTSSDKQPSVGTQELFLSSRRMTFVVDFTPIRTNSTALRYFVRNVTIQCLNCLHAHPFFVEAVANSVRPNVCAMILPISSPCSGTSFLSGSYL